MDIRTYLQNNNLLFAGAMAIKTNTFGLNALSLGGNHALLRQAVTAGWGSYC